MKRNNRFAGMAGSYHLFEELVDGNDVLLQKEIGRLVRDLSPRPGPIRVFEAGCGTGSTAVEILAASEDIFLDSVDLDPDMVKTTQKRLESFIPNRLRVRTMDISDALRNSDGFAVFATALTLHNITPFDKRVGVLAWAFSKLSSGGVFIDGDKIADGDSDNYRKVFRDNYWKRYADRITKIGLLAQRDAILAEFWQAHEREDIPNVLRSDEYVEILRSVGFVDIRIQKELGLYKVVTALKR